MTIPSYTTDLTTLAFGILGSENWDESSDAGYDDGGAMVDDINLQYNGLSCVSAQFTKAGIGSIIYGHGSSITIPTDGAVLIHHLWAAPSALATLALGGVRILYGNSFGDFYAHNASGSDAPPSPKGGWANYAINPDIGSPGYTVGAPASPYSYFGMAVSAVAQARGNPNACNAVRYGRCVSYFEHGELGNYATFAGYADVDYLIDNKWNLVDRISASAFDVQGLMSLGTATNPVDFRDSNKTLNFLDTINVTSGFNKIEVNNAASNVEWENININSLGTTSKGSFQAVDNGAITKITCVFTDMSTFGYLSNSTITTSTHRRCDLITQAGATFQSGTVDAPNGSVGMLVSDLSLIAKYTFNSSGTGHGIDLGSIVADIALPWDNSDFGFTASSAGNETILVNVASGITLTINVSATATTPSVYNTGAGTVSVVSGQVTTTMSGHPVGATVLVFDLNSADPQNLGDELARFDNAAASVQYQYSGGKSGDDVQIKALQPGYKTFSEKLILPATDNTSNTTMETETN